MSYSAGRSNRDRERRISEIVSTGSHAAASSPRPYSLLLQLALGFCGMALVLLWIRIADRGASEPLDPIVAEEPSDFRHPFNETRREAQLKLKYHEPAATQTATIAVAKVGSGAGRNPMEGIEEATLAKALRFYGLRCAPCHGEHGGGDGPAAEMIKPRPRSFADPAWQAAVSDETIATAMLRGGAAVGKSYMMPASPDLKAKPEQVTTLTRIVRSFGEGQQSIP